VPHQGLYSVILLTDDNSVLTLRQRGRKGAHIHRLSFLQSLNCCIESLSKTSKQHRATLCLLPTSLGYPKYLSTFLLQASY